MIKDFSSNGICQKKVFSYFFPHCDLQWYVDSVLIWEIYSGLNPEHKEHNQHKDF